MFTVEIDAKHLHRVLVHLGTDRGAYWLAGFERFCVQVNSRGLAILEAMGI